MPEQDNTDNQQLQHFLKKLAQQIASANSRDAINAIIDKVHAFGRPLKYNNRNYWLGLIVSVIAATLGLVYLYFYPQNSSVIWSSAACGISSVVFAALIFRRRNAISRLADALFQKEVYLDNAWQAEPYQAKRLAAHLGHQFNEFKRGNHLREISWLVKGHFSGEAHQFDYHAYRFHYVNRRQVTSTSTDSKGRTRTHTRTVYDHHYRYGVYLAFNFVRHLAISSSWFGGLFGSTYKPASLEFNRHFKVNANNEMEAAKFLKPAVVVEIEDLRKIFKGLNLEFNASGQLCVSFDTNIFQWKRQHGFDSPEAFSKEIQQNQTIFALNELLTSIHTLLRHSDNNF